MEIRFDELLEAQMRQMRSHELLRLAQQGVLPARALARYLESVLHLLRHTVPHLTRAGELAERRGSPRLAGYFAKKLAEERGHDAWAEADLRALSVHLGVHIEEEPVCAIHSLVEFIGGLIEDDPHRYLIYIITNEYLMVSAGPVWLQALTHGSKAPAEALTVLSRHIAADQGHVEDGLADAESLLPQSFPMAQVQQVISRTIALFGELFSEIAQSCQESGAALGEANDSAAR